MKNDITRNEWRALSIYLSYLDTPADFKMELERQKISYEDYANGKRKFIQIGNELK